MPALEKGVQAPEFNLSGADGNSFSPTGLSDGEVAVVAFYKATCPTCHFAAPYLQRMYENHASSSKVRFFAVAQEDAAGAKDFSDRFNFTIPTALDQAPYKVSDDYGLTNVPTVFMVNSDGIIEQSTVGFVKAEYEELAEKLAKIDHKSPADLFQGEEVPGLKPG